jgi:hypothetical protein
MKTRALGVAIGVFALALVAALFFQDTVREVVVLPILYLIWLGGLLLRSFDQGCLWSAGLLVALVLALNAARKPSTFRDVPPQTQSRSTPVGRIHQWRNQVSAGRASDVAHDSFRTDLRRLLADVWAHQYHQPLDDVRRQLRLDQLPLPDVVRSMLGLTASTAYRRQPWWKRIGQWFNSKASGVRAASSSPELDGTLDYLEELMEVVDDTHTR